MLVISRREGESIQIGDSITITVVRVDSRGVRIGIQAPIEASVMRRELVIPEPSTDGPPANDSSSGRAF